MSNIDHINNHNPFSISDIRQHLKDLAQQSHYRKGTVIPVKNGLQFKAVYILQGSARAFYLKGGKDYTYSFAFDLEYVLVSKFLLDNPDYVLSIEFLENSEVIEIPVEQIRDTISSQSKAFQITTLDLALKSFIARTRDLEETLFMFQTLDAVERYRWLINRHPQILSRATATQVASYLGVSKETLYRIRSGKYK